jgi:heme o synthase
MKRGCKKNDHRSISMNIAERQAVFQRLSDRVHIIKPAVSLLSAAAALMGYCAQAGMISAAGCAMSLSMFFLSGGAAALNNIQDLSLDSRMSRTRARPLPAGRIRVQQVLVQSATMIIAGLAGLAYSAPSILPLLAGLAALVLYNGLYTPLKKKTYLAIIPGVLCGMLPPLAGWLAAGGDPLSLRIWYIMALLGIWQVPHTWLLLFCRDDCLRLNIPTIRDAVSAAHLKSLIFIWAAAFAVLTLYWRMFGMQAESGLFLPVLVNGLAMPAVFALIFVNYGGAGKYRGLFHYLTASMAVIIALPVIDAVLRTIP